ncbi:hypothetical protein BCh11DRAFT_06489 [Burkholderia sp. Ch1-1]|nr:hypothetical protein BCh11DRAFT_06489 [Burkholderia sp. Ch1-1]
MQFSQLPTLLKLAFAALGGKNSIPVASQLPGNINGASYTDGFPPATRTAIVAGGKPPAGLDMNGVLFDLSSNVRWMNAGGPFPYSSAFATDANVGGYPQGAEIASADLEGTWVSQNDNNTDNPDTGPGTKWIPGRAYGVTAVTGLTNANVTLTPAQAAKSKITLAGTLTGNVQIILPTWLKDWVVTNNTTGAFTVTAKTAAGSGVAIPQDGSPTKITGDGTNIAQLAENVAPATQSQHAAQLQQIGHGQCRLVIGGGTALSLTPFGGNNLIINGVPQQIPSAGVTASNSGLAASTVYFVYAAMSGGVMVLNFSTTGHSTAPNGVETKTGDTTQTLVGMIRTNSSSQFISTAAAIGLINWFNRQLIPLLSSNSVNSTTSTSFVNVGPSVTFITWVNSSIPFFMNGYGFNSTAADGVSAQIGLDAATGLSTISNLVSATANASSGLNSILSSAVTEGFHTIAGYGCALTGGNANFVLSLSGAIYG